MLAKKGRREKRIGVRYDASKVWIINQGVA